MGDFCLDKKENEQEEYTIKIIPSHGDTTHSIRLPANLLKYGIASFGIGAFLLVGAFAYAVYSTFTTRNDATEIEELRQVNSIQQEQMLILSKKATALQDELEQLGQMENELRRMSGASAVQDSAADAQTAAEEPHDGQGGPYLQPNVKNLNLTLDLLEKRVAVRKTSMEGLRQELKAQQEKLIVLGSIGMGVMGGVNGSIPSIWPASGEVSSPYGLRWGGSDFHPGIDIANDMGTPIVATADGIVTIAGWNSGGYGNMVDIDHGNGLMTRYGHASQVVVTAGQHVRKGQLIAYMGSTGFSTGPHVHYEVHVNGQTVNPVGYL